MSYISFINPEGQIEQIASDGTQRQRLSDDLRFYQFPAWSPDGRSIAAIGRDNEVGHVVIIDLDDNDLRTVYQSDRDTPFYLYWSPDSDHISFLANHQKGGLALHASQITLGTTEVLALGQPFFWAWHPAEPKVLFHAGGGSVQSRVAYLSPTGGYEDQSLTAPGLFQAPGISHDGRYIAFANVAKQGGSQIVIEQANRRQRIEKQHVGTATLSWSPMSNQLAYISPEIDAPHFFGPLKLLNAQNGRHQQLVDETVLAFFWSPNGRYIAYITPVELKQALLPITEGYAAGRSLRNNTQGTVWLNLSILDTVTEETRLLTPFQPNSLFTNQLIPFFDQYALSHRIWSPRSDNILLPALVDSEPWLVTVPTNGFPPIPIARGLMGSWSHT